ncbi:MAG: hydroxyacid dehydrogenase [Thermoleophilia bacterium]|nr:hydroxyacid dehydrogenase [Thermoleophilia bacterium]
MRVRVALFSDWLNLDERLRDVPEVELVDELADADAVVCNRLTADDTRGARRLRLVQALSAGADSIERDALPPGCALCNAYSHEDAIGEWAVLTMLTLTRHLLAYDRALRDGEWLRPPLERELRGRTLGAVGYGHIARRTVELVRPFGMEAAAVTRTPVGRTADGLRWLGGLNELDRLLSEADVVLLALPLTGETERLIGRRELDLLGAEGYLLNPARGGLVDERALYEALKERRIAGAALDTWWRYPERRGERTAPSAFPFGELDNVVMTPHSSGHTEGTERGRRELVVAQLLRLARGEPLENVVTVAR